MASGYLGVMATHILAALALLSGPAGASPIGSASPWRSHDRLVSANGFGVAVFDGSHSSGAVLSDFRDHLYQQLDATSEPGRDLLYDSYFGLGDGSSGSWLTATDAYSYRHGSGILEIDRSTGDLQITELVFAPMSLSAPAYVHLLHVRNVGAATASPRLFSLHNHHVGSDSHGIFNGSEDIWVDGDLLAEAGSDTGLGMAVVALGSPSSYSCDTLWSRMPSEGALDGRCGTASSPWNHDDQVGGWQWDPGALAPGAETWVGVVAGFFDEGDAASAADPIESWVAGRTAAQLVEDEEAAWASWLSGAAEPVDATADELAVYHQALVFLKMAQVQEDGDAHGQIPASLPVAASGGTGDDSFTHLWNITWVRDSAYAIQALTTAGFTDEARGALAFLLQGKAGDYRHLVGRDYALSVCRLYGDGSEWSDDDGTGPNVELDNFGLLLWALGTYVEATGDVAFVEARSEIIFEGIADVLVDTVGEDGLVMADSSIWERHWGGNQQHFAYTQLWAVAGLRQAADLAAAVGDDERAATYRAAATGIRGGICDELIDSAGVLAASSEQLALGSSYLDLAGVDAFNNGTLDAGGPEGLASIEAWSTGLAVASGGGVARNDDGDLYDLQEWVWADLRLAQSKRRACDEDGARALEDWVTAQAMANNWTIPELMSPDTAAFAGPAPMMGFGSGLYTLNLLGRLDAVADCEAGVTNTCDSGSDDSGSDDSGSDDSGSDDSGSDDSGSDDSGSDDTSGPADDKGGCGCSAGAPQALMGLMLPAFFVVQRRRRRSVSPGCP